MSLYARKERGNIHSFMEEIEEGWFDKLSNWQRLIKGNVGNN